MASDVDTSSSKRRGALSPVAKELLAGTVGGCLGIIAGQPLDTVKLRMQAPMSRYTSSLQCFVTTLRLEGIRALYKGMVSPLMGNGPINAIVFASYGTAMRQFDAAVGTAAAERHKFVSIGVAGALAGLCQGPISSPVELLKCKLQAQGEALGTSNLYNGPFDCLRKRTAEFGLRVGVFRGFCATLCRDIPTFGTWFLTYEYAKGVIADRLPRRGDGKPHDVALLLAGGLSGVSCWLVTYPFDTIKSIVQTMPDNRPAQEFKMRNVARLIFRSSGIGGFFRGVYPTMLRAFPANAVIFYGFEYFSRVLDVL